MVPKTEKFKDTPLGDFFNVEVKALPDYDYKQERFKEEVSQLKERIMDSITVGGDRGCVVPASGFCLYVKELWETIKQNKNLDLPTHKKMVAMVRCEEIATQKLTLFKSDEEWLEVEAEAKERLVSEFRDKISSILNNYLSEYDSESLHFDEEVRNAKRQNLESQALQVVNPACVNTLNHLRSEILRKFKTLLEERLSKGEGYGGSVRICRQSCETEFDRRCSDVATEQAEWHASFVRKELFPYMEIHALHLHTTMLPQVVEKHREQLATTINRHLLHLFNKLELDEDKLSWGHIRSFLKRETDWAVEDFRDEVSAFELEETTLQRKVDELKVYARRSVENKFKEQAQFIMQLLYTRYICPSMSEDEDRFLKCLKLMSIMAAIRLEESSRDYEVENLLVSVLINGGDEVPANDPLASRTWEELDIQTPREMTLITPLGCKDIWSVFKKDIETEHKKIETAHIMKIETAHKQSHESKSLEGNEEFMSLPLWAKLGALLLGPNKFVLLLRDSRFDLAIKLAGTGIELVGCLADQVYKSMNTTHCKIMNKLKAIIGKFYDFMAAMFAMKTQLRC